MNQNILDYEIKSISLDSLKLKSIFEESQKLAQNNKHIDLSVLHNNYKTNILFKKFITLAIKLNCKIFKLENGHYILKSKDELILYCTKIKKILLKKYAINILKNVIDDDTNNILDKINFDFQKLKKYFIYLEMFDYILNNIYNDFNILNHLCTQKRITQSIPEPQNTPIESNIICANIISENSSKISSDVISGKLECISSNSGIDILFDPNINYNLSSYVNYIPSKGKVINISLKSYIAEYSN